ncbi:hypothetical protein DL764_009329 [Monosporascus ibericus]|uniref:Sensitive to high expression protein 9, mitochondrial n=1 Tax=Monosporascus ibericus TaxID=155417 RepID=A0A4Q4SY15_9PEZI|nr:hypothetical protein DL764_009329 [Monosporascus ibericus]
MSAPRAIKPLLGTGSRLLIDQLLLPSRSIAATVKLIARPPRAPAPSSICLSCSFTLGRQLRFSSSSTNPPPPKPPSDEEPRETPGSGRETPPASDSSLPWSPSAAPEDPGRENTTTTTTTNTTTTDTRATPSSPPPPPPNPNPNPNPNPDLPSAQNSRRSALNQQLSSFMDRAQNTLFSASRRLNDLTGYSGIETLKSEISGLEASLAAAQQSLHSARAAYKAAVSGRAATQREVTTLLARQKTWTPADFERFTHLYRQDYELEASVADTAAELERAEREAERAARDLSTAILARYHEEQIWSDKIRRMSTWGTWGLMGVNVLLFLVFQFGAEPWRRARLVRGFEQKVREALEEEREKMRAVRAEEEEERWRRARAEQREREEREAEARRADQDAAAAAASASASTSTPVAADSIPEVVIVEEPSVSWREYLSDPEWWKAALADLYSGLSDPERWRAAFADLCSDRTVAVRMRDLSIVALEGAAAGAVLAGTVAVFFCRAA